MELDAQSSIHTAGDSHINIDEKILSLFEPDTLLSAQYFENLRSKTFVEPESRLMLAVLEDAVNCFQANLMAQSGRRKKLFKETDDWIRAQDDDWIFSFVSICEILRLNPEYVRQGLRRWKEKKLAHRAPQSRGERAIAGYRLAANSHS
jgi:hypothetical protein